MLYLNKSGKKKKPEEKHTLEINIDRVQEFENTINTRHQKRQVKA